MFLQLDRWILIVSAALFAAVALAAGHSASAAAASAGKVAAPTFQPVPGEFISSTTIRISCGTPGATVHYTVDGSMPTPDHGIPCNVPVILITSTTTLKAVAFKDGMAPSDGVSGTYTIRPGASCGALITQGAATFFDGRTGDGRHKADEAFDRNLGTLVAAGDKTCLIGRAGVRRIPTAVRIMPPPGAVRDQSRMWANQYELRRCLDSAARLAFSFSKLGWGILSWITRTLSINSLKKCSAK